MFKWCSYCQRLIGEVEPFELFEFSHGICSNCLKSSRWKPAFSGEVHQLAQFYHKVLEVGRRGDLSQAPKLLEMGLDLGIRPLDFMVGFIQPALYQIGTLWESGAISIAEEHRFTAFASQLIDLCYQTIPQITPQQPDILLVSAPGNYHSLGLRIVEQWLRSNQYQVFTVFPGIPEEEILKLTSQLKPKYVGISIAESNQQDFVSKLSMEFAKTARLTQQTPILLVGGPALRRKEWKPIELANTYYCKDVFSLKTILISEESKNRIKRGA